MSALYNAALRQSKGIRSDLDTFEAGTTTNITALQGQIATSITTFARTLDDYQKNIDIELVADKAEKGRDRISTFRTDLLDFRSRLAELKHEREHAKHVQDRTELLGSKRSQQASQTPENPYADAAISSGAGSRGRSDQDLPDPESARRGGLPAR